MDIKDLATLLKNPLDKLLTSIGNEFKQIFSNRILEYQSEEYRRNESSKTILHRAEPKKLSDFYIPLKIIQRENMQASRRKFSTDSCKKLFAKNPYITLIGSAGSGKSTLLKYLFVNCVTEGYKIPIKIELRYLNDYKNGLLAFVFDAVFKYQKLGVNETIIERLLDSGMFIFFFDGYDEINTTIKEQATFDIDNFVNRFNKNNFLITSRPFTNIESLPMFVNFDVCQLEKNEISAFVTKQLPAEEIEISEKIIAAINSQETRGYRSFLSNPLLLSMFILTFQAYANVPPKRSDFYDQVFDTLFSVHDSMSKLAYRREKPSGLNKAQFEEVLRLFSFLTFFEEKFLFPEKYILTKLDLIKQIKTTIHFENSKFIDDLQIAIGILNLDGLEYTFPHRSLQEYFAASYIQHLSPENKKKVYLKIHHTIEESGMINFINKDHFYHLLSELDYYYCIKELGIPIIKRTLLQVSNGRLTKEKAYVAYGRLLLVFRFLFDEKYHPGLSNRVLLRNGTPPSYVFFHSNSGKGFSYMKTLTTPQEVDIENIKDLIATFRSNGQKIISEIEESLENINKGDETIINLIK